MLVLAACTAIPAVAAGAAAIGSGWTPLGDHAPLEVMVRDVGTGRSPLVGPFSRLEGNHPGPIAYYLLAVPYRLVGARPWALLLGAALINAVAIALAVRIAGRRGQTRSALALAALILVTIPALTDDHLHDPWNPHLAVFAFLLAAVATWAALCGSRWCLVVAVGAASFCVQQHVGYLLLAGTLALWWIVALVRARVDLRRWRAPMLVAVAVTGLMWLPPAIEQLTASGPGNLEVVASAARQADEPRSGPSGTIDVLRFHLDPTSLLVQERPVLPEGQGSLAPVGLVAIGGAWVLAARRGRPDDVARLAVTSSLWVAGAVALVVISGPAWPYIYIWMRVLAILLWWSVAVVVGRAGAGWLDRRPTRATTAWARPAMAVALGSLTIAVTVGVARPPFADERSRVAGTETLATRTVDAVATHPGNTGVVLLRRWGPLVWETPAVVAALERAGHRVLVDPPSPATWGASRVPGAEVADITLWVTTETTPPVPGAVPVASGTGLPPVAHRAVVWLADGEWSRAHGPRPHPPG